MDNCGRETVQDFVLSLPQTVIVEEVLFDHEIDGVRLFFAAIGHCRRSSV